MNIFYQYANCKQLTPTRGDFISEINIIKALSKFARVNYANSKIKSDIYYVRGNPILFKHLPHPKIYFASVYNQDAFGRADAIATFSSEWTRRLKEGVPHTAGCSVKILKPVITIQQVLDDMFRPLQGHLQTKKIRRMFGDINGDKFIIGQFGSMRHSNYPFTFLKILPELVKKYPNIITIFSETTGIKNPLIKRFNFPYQLMPYALSACDLLLMPYWSVQGHYSGSTRTKEAMACGVPIISPRFIAREEELGKDYEFFYPATGSNFYDPLATNGMKNLIEMAINNRNMLKIVGAKMQKRSQFYSIEESAKRLEKDFRMVMNQ